MAKNSEIYFLVGDVGFGIFDSIKTSYPDRFLNIGSSEQLMVGIAAGMAMEGKLPICYSITPFLLYRPFEFIRNFMNEELLPIKLVGSGRDGDYKEAGFTHHAYEANAVLQALENIEVFFPTNGEELKAGLSNFIYSKGPGFLSLSR
jgi:transketolase